MSIEIGDIDDLKAKVKKAFNKVLDKEIKDMYIEKIDCITPAMAEKIKDIFYKKIKKHKKYKEKYKQKKEGGGKKKRKTRKIQKGGFLDFLMYTFLAISALSILAMPIALAGQCIYRGYEHLRENDQLEGYGIYSDRGERAERGRRKRKAITRKRAQRIQDRSKSPSRMSHGEKLKFIFNKYKINDILTIPSIERKYNILNLPETIMTQELLKNVKNNISLIFRIQEELDRDEEKMLTQITDIHEYRDYPVQMVKVAIRQTRNLNYDMSSVNPDDKYNNHFESVILWLDNKRGIEERLKEDKKGRNFYRKLWKKTLLEFLKDNFNRENIPRNLWIDYKNNRLTYYENLLPDDQKKKDITYKVNEKKNKIISDISYMFERFIDSPNYPGDPYTVNVTPLGDNPDEVNYEFEHIPREDGKSSSDEDDKEAVQRAIHEAQISQLADQGTYSDGSKPGYYDDNGYFIHDDAVADQLNQNPGPYRVQRQWARLAGTVDGRYPGGVASDAYVEAYESHNRQKRHNINTSSNEGYMNMEKYKKEQKEGRRNKVIDAEAAATESSSGSRGFGLRERFGHKYKYDGGKKKRRQTRRLKQKKRKSQKKRRKMRARAK